MVNQSYKIATSETEYTLKGNNMKITKSNMNYANKQGLDLNVELDLGSVLIFVQGEDENILEYTLEEVSCDVYKMTFKCQVYGNKIEDLPAHITTVKQLNTVLKYVGEEVKRLGL